MTARIQLRPAAAGDARLLFDWVNQADSLAGKLATAAPISWPDHSAWFEKRLAAPDCGIWIAERDGDPVGQVRAERDSGGSLHVDIYVSSEARREGVGAAMLGALTAESAARWPGTSLIARIRNDNAPSRRFFEANGYCLSSASTDHAVLVRTATS